MDTTCYWNHSKFSFSYPYPLHFAPSLVQILIM